MIDRGWQGHTPKARHGILQNNSCLPVSFLWKEAMCWWLQNNYMSDCPILFFWFHLSTLIAVLLKCFVCLFWGVNWMDQAIHSIFWWKFDIHCYRLKTINCMSPLDHRHHVQVTWVFGIDESAQNCETGGRRRSDMHILPCSYHAAPVVPLVDWLPWPTGSLVTEKSPSCEYQLDITTGHEYQWRSQR